VKKRPMATTNPNSTTAKARSADFAYRVASANPATSGAIKTMRKNDI
jgi:hypothetical protein